MLRLVLSLIIITAPIFGFNPIAFGVEKSPNVLFIAIDDLNDWVGVLGGHPQVQTPHMDRLADRGTLFTNAHCQSPLCNPSRTSVMTGLRPSTTGIYGLSPWFRTVPALKDVVTLPQRFANAGYKTFTVGKIYHGGGWLSGDVEEFDVIGRPEPGLRPKEKRVKTPRGGRGMDWGVYPFEDSDQRDWKTASWAVEQLEGMEDDKPFFMAVGFSLPHVPLLATQQWFDLYPEEEVELPGMLLDDRKDTPRFSWYLHWKLPEPRQRFLLESGEQLKIVQAYLASISFVDSQVGRVLSALEENGLADDTVVVLWSDHGYHLGEKEITGKNTLWEPSTRVPLIFAGPGVSRKQEIDSPSELLDMYPTLSELCGLEIPDHVEGQSLMLQIKGLKAARIGPAITTHNHDNHGIRTDNWRFIQYADGSEELYDLKKDPDEFNNLVNDSTYISALGDLRAMLPKANLKPVEGSRHRILIYENGEANWEGEAINLSDPIPN